MIIRNTRWLRAIAVFCLFTLLTNLAAPTVAWALTAGPTAPEATSFEPVDTTDMVNLATGDFTYNIPLLEVPGPEGGYPLSLSYHSGIMPDEEASWVGLGWTLNPGSITRTINGYPDDHHNATQTDRFYWEGGERDTYTIGISVGAIHGPKFTAGVQYSEDTFQGKGIGGYLGVSVSVGKYAGVGGRIGVSPYGSTYASVNIREKYLNEKFSKATGGQLPIDIGANVGVSTNFESISASAGVGVSTGMLGQTVSLVGMSISSSGKGSISMMGTSINRINNSKINKISSSSSGFNVEIPVLPVVSITLGHRHERYWIDESEDIATNGVLYYPNNDEGSNINFDETAFDSYDLFDPAYVLAKPEKELGGTYPAYDQYNVNGQGIGGSIKPYLYAQYLTRQNIKDGDTYTVKHYHNSSLRSSSQKTDFRFVNDFSNKIRYNTSWDVEYNEDPNTLTPLSLNGSALEPETGEFVDYVLPGSQSINWFTNKEILNGLAKSQGFINCTAPGFVRPDDDQIGGIMITNTSGVTYHYALPVYAFGEYSKSENTTSTVESYNELRKPEKYAYTWYLTAVTGVDYVDRDLSGEMKGKVNEGDWGYWVSFEYGKWAENYRWRSPAEGFHMDIDNKFQFFSFGKKEIYYLDAIKTQTHTALFVKSSRKDGKSIISQDNGRFRGEGYEREYIGHHPITGHIEKLTPLKPISLLKLDHVYLLKNDVLKSLTANEELRDKNTVYNNIVSGISKFRYYSKDFDRTEDQGEYQEQIHFGKNILDDNDLVNIKEDLNKGCIRRIDLLTDYSLCSETPNTFYSASDKQNNYNEDEKGDGKLTLKSLQFRGQEAIATIPAMHFEYGDNPKYKKDAYDLWNMYKSDYRDTGNENLDRTVTKTSSQHVDAWSLSEVFTSLGAKVEVTYESDSYSKSILHSNHPLNIDSFEKLSGDRVKVLLSNTSNYQLNEFFVLNEEVDIFYAYNVWELIYSSDLENPPQENIYDRASRISGLIKEIGSNYLEIESPSLVHWLFFDYVREGEREVRHTPRGGNISSRNLKKTLGGGLRVKKISITEPITERKYITSYDYTIPGSGISSGVTSYEPGIFDLINNNVSYIEEYKKLLYESFSNLLINSREVPPPNVMYEYVTVKDYVVYDGQEEILPQYIEYNFEVFEEGMLHYIADITKTHATGKTNELGSGFVQSKNISLKNYTSRVGQLNRVVYYNKNHEKVSETRNEYLHDQVLINKEDYVGGAKNVNYLNDWADEYDNHLSVYANQGVIEEVFGNIKLVQRGTTNSSIYDIRGVISRREEYPAIQTGITQINYQTGVKTTSRTLAFDMYAGTPTKTLTTDGYGNQFLSVTKHAYKDYPEMGVKIPGQNRKNMLSQTSASYTFKGASEDWNQLIGASIQTWNKQWQYRDLDGSLVTNHPDIWRKHRTYTWQSNEVNPDGTYIGVTAFDAWNAGTEPNNPHWQKNSEITLFDRYSHALEAKDLNGNYAASKMGDKESMVYASASNARYTEFAYSGAEDVANTQGYFGGEVHKGGGQIVEDAAIAHTGEYHLSVPAGSKGFVFKLSDPDVTRTYRLSVWTNQLQGRLYYSTDGGQTLQKSPAPVSTKKSGNWYLLNYDIQLEPSVTSLEVGCFAEGVAVGFDDFRFHPIDASMQSFVYDPITGQVTYILNPHNLYTRFEYDAAGRLKRTYQESLKYQGEKKVSEHDYHYAREQE
ncbi:hypothetical protein AAG747_25310 [Rapidithrix thailandica]|uniref:RHS repeat-associated core domain-containing protein n=1 Tax=Rapidithrix thailandica TaxID=413964 RepID=A0AAW9SK94_9BACT